MSSWVILAVLVIVGLLYMSAVGKKADKPHVVPKKHEQPPTVPTQPTPPATTPTAPVPVVQKGPKTYEVIDFMNPKLRVGTDVLNGTKGIIVWDSPRVNQLRKDFHVKNVIDRTDFEEGTKNRIEVYRAVSDNVYTYVFPDANTDEVIQLKMQVQEDPSMSNTPKKAKAVEQEDTTSSYIPPGLIAKVKEFEKTYALRQSSSGPKAIDTHSSS